MTLPAPISTETGAPASEPTGAAREVSHEEATGEATGGRVPTWREIFRPGLVALRRQWRPFVLIQIVGLALVVGFYTLSPVEQACRVVARAKEQSGWWGAMLASAVAGAMIPELAKLAAGHDSRTARQRWGDLLFNFVFFGLSGWVVYEFYRLQDSLWGTSPSVATTAKKVLFDQLVFSVFWSVPVGLICFSWKRAGLSLRRTLPEITLVKLVQRAPGMTIPMWGFWVPMTSMIYALPRDLQFGLFILALAAWSLLLAFVAGGEDLGSQA